MCARALAGALLFGEKVIICSAHEQRTSRWLFGHLAGFFENYDALRKRVKSIGYALGREEIKLRDGTWLFFPARTRGALRGYSIDALLLDEAQLISDQQWEALKPALSARPNAVTWMFGTCPQLSTDAEVFGRLRAAAHAGTRKGLAWIEYGAAPGCALGDREQWAAANPGRIDPLAMEAEYRELSKGGFARERLNAWPVDRIERVIDPSTWAALAGPGPPDATTPAALAVDSSPDRVVATAAAWRLDGGRVHVELVAADYADPLDALAWLTERANYRTPVVIDGSSVAASLISALERERVKVVTVGARDMARAAGAFLNDVNAGRLSHIGQELLNASVAGAGRRPIGDSGLWSWDRRSGAPVSPLVACTLARHGAVTERPRTGRATFV
jgi:hypothetical protein